MVRGTMRTLLALTTLLIAVLVAALPSGAAADTTRIRVGDLFFDPQRITINAGDTVRWRWVGEAKHNVAVKRGPVKFKSEIKASGRFTKTLDETGTYRYICTVHPDDMRGRIVVE
jgi:plastocyanin